MKTKKLIIKSIKPMFTKLVTTSDVYTKEECINEYGLIENNKEGLLKEIQRILFVNPDNHQGLKVGDLVCLNFNRYQVRQFAKDSTKDIMEDVHKEVTRYEIPRIEINKDFKLMIDTGDVEFVIQGFEYEEKEVTLNELLPNKPVIIGL